VKKNVFCPIPWNFSAIRSNGDFRVCCHANQSVGQGILVKENGANFNAATDSFESTRNAPRLKDMRKKMLDGLWPSECIRCKNEEESGLRSRRDYEKDLWFIDHEYAALNTSFDGEIKTKDFPLHYLDLRFGNKCNLKCRMCGPQDSSSWYQDYVKLHGQEYFKDTHGKVILNKSENNKYMTRDYDWHEEDFFWSYLENIADDVKKIYMAGGEPLLIDKHFDFLNRCIEKGYAKNIILEYNTNLTVLDERTVSLWSSFKTVNVGASIDGYGAVFEYQRYPAKWENVYNNMKYLDSLPKNINSWLALTVTNYNIFHLADFIKWKVKESGFKRVSSRKSKPFVTHHMCHGPKHLNIKSLHYDLKQKVIGQFLELRTWARNESFEQEKLKILDDLLSGIEKFMMSEHYNNEWDTFIETTKKLDHLRGQSILEVVPDFKGYF